MKTNKAGIPDLLAVKEGKCRFIEVKRKNGKLSEIQKYRLQELAAFTRTEVFFEGGTLEY
ncbi:MAG TPA: VRR-NUC domain-containing protein [Luteibaculaceae bacterium]|nr:VRR-NUC domain-containing protein [Luteibaculaceae bacterium]